MQKENRPVFLNLVQIRLPVAGVLSILHRLTGVLLFFVMPFLIYLVQLVLADEAGYRAAAAYLASPLAAVVFFLLLWSLLHHLLAGIRYLLIDLHLGVERPVYRYTAWFIMLAAPLLALLLTVALL